MRRAGGQAGAQPATGQGRRAGWMALTRCRQLQAARLRRSAAVPAQRSSSASRCWLRVCMWSAFGVAGRPRSTCMQALALASRPRRWQNCNDEAFLDLVSKHAPATKKNFGRLDWHHRWEGGMGWDRFPVPCYACSSCILSTAWLMQGPWIFSCAHRQHRTAGCGVCRTWAATAQRMRGRMVCTIFNRMPAIPAGLHTAGVLSVHTGSTERRGHTGSGGG